MHHCCCTVHEQKFCSFFSYSDVLLQATSTLSVWVHSLQSERLQPSRLDPYWESTFLILPRFWNPTWTFLLHRLSFQPHDPILGCSSYVQALPEPTWVQHCFGSTHMQTPLSHLGSTPQTEQPPCIDIFFTTLVLWYFPLGFKSHHNIIPHLSSPIWTDCLLSLLSISHQAPSCMDIPPYPTLTR